MFEPTVDGHTIIVFLNQKSFVLRIDNLVLAKVKENQLLYF